MATSAFSLFGELKLDRSDFTKGLAASEKELQSFKSTIAGVEKAVSSAFSNIGATMQSLGKGMTVGITAPLTGLGALATSSAVGFDTLRTQLTAATGSVGTASDKFKELNKLAQENAGVLTSGAVATYNYLKPLGIAEETINEVIKSFGKLKAANPDVDLQRMGVNLGQLFDQGFEQQDLKELYGNFPRAGEILKKAFNLSGSDRTTVAAEMKGLMEKGLTKEDFFAGFASGVNTDSFMANVTDPVAVRFEKMKERIMLAIEPLGMLLLSTLERFTPSIIAFIERVSSAFTSMSPTMQMVVVGFGLLAAAAGPVLYVLGGIVTAIAGVLASASTIAVIGAIIAGLGVALLPVIAIAAFFYQAWVDNWDLVKQVFSDGVATVTSFVTNGLQWLEAFWMAHGESIMTYLTSWWNTLSTVVSQGMEIVSNVMQLVLELLSGNWAAAWETILQLTTQVWTLISTAIGNALGVVGNLIAAWGPVFVKGMTWAFTQVLTMVGAAAKLLIDIFFRLPQILISLIPKFIAAGSQIGAAIQTGIANGIRNWLNPVAAGDIGGGFGPDTNSISGLIDQFKSLFGGSGIAAAGLGGGLGAAFDPVIAKANTTSDALDKVKKKITEVKTAAVPKPAAKAVTDEARKVYGKAVTLAPGGIVMDVGPMVPGAATSYKYASQDATNEILSGLTTAVKEGKLAIEIIDPNRSTSLGATSSAVNARYKQ